MCVAFSCTQTFTLRQASRTTSSLVKTNKTCRNTNFCITAPANRRELINLCMFVLVPKNDVTTLWPITNHTRDKRDLMSGLYLLWHVNHDVKPPDEVISFFRSDYCQDDCSACETLVQKQLCQLKKLYEV